MCLCADSAGSNIQILGSLAGKKMSMEEGRFGAGIAAAANGVFLGQVRAYQHPLLRPPEGSTLLTI